MDDLKVRLARRRASPESDEGLTMRARAGDDIAFGELYRRHRKSATATARCLLRSSADADDAVSDAFASVLNALRNGHGPRDNFRTYVLACVRNGCRSRRIRPTPTSDEVLEQLGPSFEDPERYVEADTVARAFASLNPRWQQALWMSEVEQRPPQELCRELMLKPNATSALTLRARQAFATAYLTEHVAVAVSPECARFAPRLAAYVRGRSRNGDRHDLEEHLAGCEHCTAAVAELSDMNGRLRSLLPVNPEALLAALGTSATAATSTAATSTTAAGSAFAPAVVVGSSMTTPVVGLFVKAMVTMLAIQPLLTSDTGNSAGLFDAEPAPANASTAASSAGPAALGDAAAPLEPVVVAAESARVAAPAVPTDGEPKERRRGPLVVDLAADGPAGVIDPVDQGLDDVVAELPPVGGLTGALPPLVDVLDAITDQVGLPRVRTGLLAIGAILPEPVAGMVPPLVDLVSGEIGDLAAVNAVVSVADKTVAGGLAGLAVFEKAVAGGLAGLAEAVDDGVPNVPDELVTDDGGGLVTAAAAAAAKAVTGPLTDLADPFVVIDAVGPVTGEGAGVVPVTATAKAVAGALADLAVLVDAVGPVIGDEPISGDVPMAVPAAGGKAVAGTLSDLAVVVDSVGPVDPAVGEQSATGDVGAAVPVAAGKAVAGALTGALTNALEVVGSAVDELVPGLPLPEIDEADGDVAESGSADGDAVGSDAGASGLPGVISAVTVPAAIPSLSTPPVIVETDPELVAGVVALPALPPVSVPAISLPPITLPSLNLPVLPTITVAGIIRSPST